MTARVCACPAHQVRRWADWHGHAMRWEGDNRFIALTDSRSEEMVLITDWFPDGTGPVKVQCPDCGQMHELGEEDARS